jgi:putative hydrolase of the HAD superfamily
MWQAIIFDGDDTLWETEALYDDARSGARAVVEQAGLDGEAWEDLERRIDVENVAELGHSSVRFPKSCVDAFDRLLEQVAQAPDVAVRHAVKFAAEEVFRRPAPLVESAHETLEILKAQDLGLALLTKGEVAVQQRRIKQSGLADFFNIVEIVPDKTPSVIAGLARSLGVPCEHVLSVGNSVRSDVLPSIAAGVAAVWIDAHVWEYERQHEELVAQGVIELSSLSDVLDLVRTDVPAHT